MAVHSFLMCVASLAWSWTLGRFLDPDRTVAPRIAVFFLGWLSFRVVPFQRVRVEGREHLPRHGAFLLVANHRSLMDTPAVLALGQPVKWIAHRRFLAMPLVGWFMRSCGDVGVDPGSPLGGGEASAREVLEWLARGRPVAVYPEGTRSASREVGRFRRGIFGLAARAGVPVVPVAVSGTEILLPARRLASAVPSFRPVTVRVRALPPLDPADHPGAEALASAARSAIVSALEEIEGS